MIIRNIAYELGKKAKCFQELKLSIDMVCLNSEEWKPIHSIYTDWLWPMRLGRTKLNSIEKKTLKILD